MHKVKNSFLKITAFVFVAAALFLFYGCTQNLDSDSASAENSVTESDYLYIVLSGVSSAKTILPTAIDFTDSTKDYYFYIWGKSTLSSVGEFSPKKVSFEAESNLTGKIPMDFPVASYYFTLAVTTEDLTDISDGKKIIEDSVLVAYSTADLNTTKNVQFYLSPNTSSGYGSVKLNLLLDSSWSDSAVSSLTNYTVTAGIYDENTDNALSSFTPLILTGLNKSTSVLFYWSSVPSGNYDFSVKFTDSSTSKVYSYTDKIKILTNQSIDSTVEIPYVIETAPASPTDFRASYVDSDETSSTEGSYKVLFNWTDNSNTESHFKLTLAAVSKMADFPSIPAAMTDSDWASITNGYNGISSVVKVFDENAESSDEYFSGTLSANSTSLMLYLPFGECYIAKIEAVNDAGISSACYVKLDEDFTAQVADSNYASGYAVYSGNAFSTSSNPCSVINRYKIIYYLNGGIYSYVINSSGFVDITDDFIVKYYTYGTTEILCPVSKYGSATQTNPSLTLSASADSSRWTRWTIDSVGGTDLISSSYCTGNTVTVDSSYSYQKADDYTGYKSLYLFANY